MYLTRRGYIVARGGATEGRLRVELTAEARHSAHKKLEETRQ